MLNFIKVLLLCQRTSKFSECILSKCVNLKLLTGKISLYIQKTVIEQLFVNKTWMKIKHCRGGFIVRQRLRPPARARSQRTRRIATILTFLNYWKFWRGLRTTFSVRVSGRVWTSIEIFALFSIIIASYWRNPTKNFDLSRVWGSLLGEFFSYSYK